MHVVAQAADGGDGDQDAGCPESGVSASRARAERERSLSSEELSFEESLSSFEKVALASPSRTSQQLLSSSEAGKASYFSHRPAPEDEVKHTRWAGPWTVFQA